MVVPQPLRNISQLISAPPAITPGLTEVLLQTEPPVTYQTHLFTPLPTLLKISKLGWIACFAFLLLVPTNGRSLYYLTLTGALPTQPRLALLILQLLKITTMKRILQLLLTPRMSVSVGSAAIETTPQWTRSSPRTRSRKITQCQTHSSVRHTPNLNYLPPHEN